MTYIKDILDFTETFAPLGTAMDFDNVGLLVGSGGCAVDTVLVALDITDAVVAEAEKVGAQLIISHHPVIFSPLKSLSCGDIPYMLAKSGISALCLHTNLDLSPIFGVNTCLADAVGVRDYAFAEGECLLVGELEAEVTSREFAARVKTALDCGGVRFTLGDKRVKKVAVCSGSGGDYAPLAAELGADALLTGEIKHHEILDAVRLGVAVIDAGHFKTEDVVIAPLCEKLSARFTDVKFIRSQKCTDTVEYC